jgi:hypothetical protein
VVPVLQLELYNADFIEHIKGNLGRNLGMALLENPSLIEEINEPNLYGREQVKIYRAEVYVETRQEMFERTLRVRDTIERLRAEAWKAGYRRGNAAAAPKVTEQEPLYGA